jgi:hypothetical protein
MSTATLERPSRIASAAVVWLNARDAVVARSLGARERVIAIERGAAEPKASYLARIVHEIGDRDRVLILGPGIARLELERFYTSINQRPDRLVDVESSGQMWADELLGRLRQLRTTQDRDAA